MEKGFSLIELFKLGGPFMWGLLAFSVATVAIVIERCIYLVWHDCRVAPLRDRVKSYLSQGKIPGVVGGEHSVTFGAVKAAAASLPEGRKLGVLQFDAHADLRNAYEGFEHSHASIMFNILSKIGNIGHLTQVGIRDFCADEHDTIRREGRISAFTDCQTEESLAQGETWDSICSRIVDTLPEDVYISFDIDGLDPSLCPNTGTPVPGGLGFQQAVYILRKVASQRNIVGFDLCEVAPGENEWDANVGARLLHKMDLFATLTKKK